MTQPKTAFVVEDDAHSLMVIGALLRERGIAYKRNTTGFGVIERIQEMLPKPDFILLDMDLPDGEPLEILRQLKADPALALIPVIGMSDDPLLSLMPETLHAGFAGFISKPLPRLQFGTMLERILLGEPIWQLPTT